MIPVQYYVIWRSHSKIISDHRLGGELYRCPPSFAALYRGSLRVHSPNNEHETSIYWDPRTFSGIFTYPQFRCSKTENETPRWPHDRFRQSRGSEHVPRSFCSRKVSLQVFRPHQKHNDSFITNQYLELFLDDCKSSVSFKRQKLCPQVLVVTETCLLCVFYHYLCCGAVRWFSFSLLVTKLRICE